MDSSVIVAGKAACWFHGSQQLGIQQFSRTAGIRAQLTFVKFKRPKMIVLDNAIYVTVWLHIVEEVMGDASTGDNSPGNDTTKGALDAVRAV